MRGLVVLAASLMTISSAALIQANGVSYWDYVAGNNTWSLVEKNRKEKLQCPNNGAVFGLKCRDAACDNISIHCADYVLFNRDLFLTAEKSKCDDGKNATNAGTVVSGIDNGKPQCTRYMDYSGQFSTFNLTCVKKEIKYESKEKGHQGEAKCPDMHYVTQVTLKKGSISMKCCATEPPTSTIDAVEGLMDSILEENTDAGYDDSLWGDYEESEELYNDGEGYYDSEDYALLDETRV